MSPNGFGRVVVGCALLGMSVCAWTGNPMIALSAFSALLGSIVLIDAAALALSGDGDES